MASSQLFGSIVSVQLLEKTGCQSRIIVGVLLVSNVFIEYASSMTWSTRDQISVAVRLYLYCYLTPLLPWLTATIIARLY